MSRNPIQPRVPPKPTPTAAVPPRPAPEAAAPITPVVPAAAPAPAATITARGAAYYRRMRYLMAVILVAVAGWFAYDGYKGWPAENEQIDALAKRHKAHDPTLTNDELTLAQKQKHSDTDIAWQKRLAFLLPCGGVLLLAWTLYRSRGQYMLRGETLLAPGHPPLELAEIAEIDASKWDRKGIADLIYRKTEGGGGKVRLDDFIYQQDGIDEIFDRVQARVDPDAFADRKSREKAAAEEEK
jgi:hypothetical protein